MKTTTLETKIHDFLNQKRIAVAGVSRDNRQHPTGNLIYRRLKNAGHDVFPVNPHMQTFEGDPCYPNVSNVAPGNYSVYAWESIPQGAYQNAEFLSRFAGRGKAVTVQAGARSIGDVIVIPKESGR